MPGVLFAAVGLLGGCQHVRAPIKAPVERYQPPRPQVYVPTPRPPPERIDVSTPSPEQPVIYGSAPQSAPPSIPREPMPSVSPPPGGAGWPTPSPEPPYSAPTLNMRPPRSASPPPAYESHAHESRAQAATPAPVEHAFVPSPPMHETRPAAPTPRRLPQLGSTLSAPEPRGDSHLEIRPGARLRHEVPRRSEALTVAPPVHWSESSSRASSPAVPSDVSRPGPAGSGWLAPGGGEFPSAARSALLRLGPGDVLTLSVVDYPELESTVYVGADGTISVPMAGKVAVGGLSPADAARKVEQAFVSGDYLIDPQVNLVVSESHSQQISVLGEVRSPGRFPIQTQISVYDALALGGGVSELGADEVYVLRRQAGVLRRFDFDLHEALRQGPDASYFELQPGDTVIVPRAQQFYIYGEVRQPDAYRLRPGTTVMQALSLGGGLTDRGSERRLEIRRKQPDGSVRAFQAQLGDVLRPDDVLFVKERFF